MSVRGVRPWEVTVLLPWSSAGGLQVLLCAVGDWEDWSRNGQPTSESSGTKAVHSPHFLLPGPPEVHHRFFSPFVLPSLLLTSSVSLWSFVFSGKCFSRSWNSQQLLLLLKSPQLLLLIPSVWMKKRTFKVTKVKNQWPSLHWTCTKLILLNSLH